MLATILLVVALGAPPPPVKQPAKPASTPAPKATPAPAPQKKQVTLTHPDYSGLVIDFVVDDGTIWFLTAEGVMKLADPGGKPVLTFESRQPRALDADATHLYWVAESTVMKAPKAGGAAVALASAQDDPRDIVIDESTVFWLTRGAVMSVSKGGGAVKTLLGGQKFPHRLALDATTVYWTVGEEAGMVMSMPKSGGEASALATDRLYPNGIATDGTSVFWLEVSKATGGTAVVTLPVGGGTPVVLADEDTGARRKAIALDDANVYWTARVGFEGRVRKVARSGGTPASITTDGGHPDSLLITGDTIYWGDFGSYQGYGSVRKIAK